MKPLKVESKRGCRFVRIVGEEITDLYIARLAIWKACKVFKKRVGGYPTTVWLPSGLRGRFTYLDGFLRGQGARVANDLQVPFNELWVGLHFSDEEFDGMPTWCRKPSDKPEWVRHVSTHKRKRARVKRYKPTARQRTLLNS